MHMPKRSCTFPLPIVPNGRIGDPTIVDYVIMIGSSCIVIFQRIVNRSNVRSKCFLIPSTSCFAIELPAFFSQLNTPSHCIFSVKVLEPGRLQRKLSGCL